MQRYKMAVLFATVIIILASAACRPAPEGCAVGDPAENSITEEGTDMLPKDMPKTKPPIDLLIPARLETATFALG